MNLLYAFLLIPYFTDSALYDRNDNLHSENHGAKANYRSLFNVKRDHPSDSAQHRAKRRGRGIASSSQCGNTKFTPDFLFQRIVGGHDATAHSYPFQVGVYEKNSYGQKKLQCGGSIIGDHFVLTAAHCLEDVGQQQRMYVKVGDHKLDSVERYEKFYEVDWYKEHPRYNKPRQLNNDLALLHTEQRIDFNAHVSPICLGRKSPFSYDTKTAIVIGWGKLSETGPLANVLQEVLVDLIPWRVCQKSYAYTPGHFCAGYEEGGKDSCQGDSGGPLFIRDNNKKYVLLGLVSWGVGCARPGLPGMYTNVSYYNEWIDAETRRHE